MTLRVRARFNGSEHRANSARRTAPPAAGTRLGSLLEGVDVRAFTGDDQVNLAALAYDSREVAPGTFFFAIRGEQTDGNRFVAEAIARGAIAIASELPRPPETPGRVNWVQVAGARTALATAAANFFGRPAETVRLAGVTGTNGKTTTVYLLDSIFRAAAWPAGMLGTITYRTPKGELTARHTTPESLDLQRFLAEVRDAGGRHAALEVSSHALALDRVWGCRFAAAVFTNLTRDHLDFHHTFEEYFAAKRRLFEGTGAGAPEAAVLNAGDPHSAALVGLARRTLTFGIENGGAGTRRMPDIRARKFSLGIAGLEFTAETPAGRIEVRSPLVGRVNVYNILAAIGAAVALDVPAAAMEKGIAQLERVPGRFERIEEGQPFLVVVDYAHTDDALRNLLDIARELVPRGRVLTVFGCGGDRDRSKRPLMGEAAGTRSDRVILTSDNPRTEDPLRIINDVVVGLQKAQANYLVEPDRARAIARAMEEARAGDIVLLAGKGHETYQILGDRTIAFDDRQVARAALRERGFAGSGA